MNAHPETVPRWTDLFVTRPVIAVVLSLALLLIGIRSAFELPVIQFPVIQSSSLEISTIIPGPAQKLYEALSRSLLSASLPASRALTTSIQPPPAAQAW